MWKTRNPMQLECNAWRWILLSSVMKWMSSHLQPKIGNRRADEVYRSIDSRQESLTDSWPTPSTTDSGQNPLTDSWAKIHSPFIWAITGRLSDQAFCYLSVARNINHTYMVRECCLDTRFNANPPAKQTSPTAATSGTQHKKVWVNHVSTALM